MELLGNEEQLMNEENACRGKTLSSCQPEAKERPIDLPKAEERPIGMTLTEFLNWGCKCTG